MDNLAKLWSSLLSKDVSAIRKTWGDLADDEAAAIADHLKHMIDDEAYSSEQKEAAKAALHTIQNMS